MRKLRDISTLAGDIIEVMMPETEAEWRELNNRKARGEVDWRESFGDYGRPNPYRIIPDPNDPGK